MPPLRVARLCALRQKEVHQPRRRPHHTPFSHANKYQKLRQDPPPSSSANPDPPSITTSQLDACIAEPDSRPLYLHSFTKRRLHTLLCATETSSPSAHVKIYHHRTRAHRRYLRVGNVRSQRHHRAPAEYHESPSRDFSYEVVGTYREPHYCVHTPHYESSCHHENLSSKERVDDQWILKDGAGKLEDLDAGHDPCCQNTAGQASAGMLLNQVSIVLPCFKGFSSTKGMSHVLDLKERRNRIPDTVLNKSMRNRPSSTIADGLQKHGTGKVDKLKPQRKPAANCVASGHPTVYKQHLTASIDFDAKLCRPRIPHSFEQSSVFLHDGIFYHTPKRRLRVNATRSSRKLETCKISPSYRRKTLHTQKLNRSNATLNHQRKLSCNNSIDSATRSLPSHEIAEPFKRISPPRSTVGLSGNLMDIPKGQNLDDLEQFVAHECAVTSQGIKKCVQIAENMNSVITNTLATLHQQGQKTTAAHEYTLEIDHDLTAGEKILGSLGSLFSKSWKPVKTRAIIGPQNANPRHSLTEAKLNSGQLNPPGAISKNRPGKSHSDWLTEVRLPWQSKVEMVEREQDEALTDLSNLMSDLKKLSLGMGNELSRQSEALNPFQDEVVELTQRLKRANIRGRVLLA